MQKYLLIFGIWVFAALVVALLHWPRTTIDRSASGAALSPSPTSATAATSAGERGKALFMAKGCAACHVHSAVASGPNQLSIGPDLTRYQPDPEFLQRWLRNPQAVRPATEMPNLNLKQDEIDALIEFLVANDQR